MPTWESKAIWKITMQLMSGGNMKQAIFFIFILLFVVFLNLFPHYYAYNQTSSNSVFSGQASWFDPWDVNAYVAAIKSGQQGNFLLKNLYTTEINNGIFIYPIYTFSGLIFSGINQFLLFHLLSIIGSVILLFAVFKFSSYFLSPPQNLIATFLVALGGGIGWLFYPYMQSADLYMTGFTFISHFQRAHEAIGMTFYLASLTLFFKATVSGFKKYYYLSLLCLVLTIFFYPYYLISFAVIIFIYANIIYFKQGKVDFFIPLVFELGTTASLTVFYYLHLKTNPTFGSVLSQNLATPDILSIFLGYGLLTPLYLMQLIWGKKDQKFLFLNTWFLSSLLLSFLPFGFARFFLRLLFFPLVISIILSLKEISNKLYISPKIIIVFLVFALPASTIFVSCKRIEEVSNNNHWYYLDKSEYKGVEFIAQHQSPGVLSTYTRGNIIPAFTNQPVYFGHFIQTPKSEEKIRQLMLFYANLLSEDEANKFLKDNSITFIYYGQEEKKITQDYGKTNKLKYNFLQPVFMDGDILIYTIN